MLPKSDGRRGRIPHSDFGGILTFPQSSVLEFCLSGAPEFQNYLEFCFLGAPGSSLGRRKAATHVAAAHYFEGAAADIRILPRDNNINSDCLPFFFNPFPTLLSKELQQQHRMIELDAPPPTEFLSTRSHTIGFSVNLYSYRKFIRSARGDNSGNWAL